MQTSLMNATDEGTCMSLKNSRSSDCAFHKWTGSKSEIGWKTFNQIVSLKIYGIKMRNKDLTTTKISPYTSIATKEFTEGVREVASCNSCKSEKSSSKDLDCTEPLEKLR